MLSYDNRASTNLQYRKIKLKSFNSKQIEIRDLKGELIPLASLGIVKLTLIFCKTSTFLRKKKFRFFFRKGKRKFCSRQNTHILLE